MKGHSKTKALLGFVLFFPLNFMDFRYVSFLKPLASIVERVRRFSLRLMGAEIGHRSYVRAHGFFTSPQFLEIGDSCTIGIGARFFLYERVRIGNNVEIGSGLTIHTAEHRIDDPDLPLAKQGSVFEPVTIEDDVYIGSNVTILSGVTVGRRTVVAAGSVVVKDLESGWVYGGVPARSLKRLES